MTRSARRRPSASVPRDDPKRPLRALYGSAELVWSDGAGRTYVGRRDRRAASMRPAGFPDRCHVITAWNPGSKKLPAAENRRRNVAFRARLRAAGVEPRSILGRAPPSASRAWTEESYVVEGLSREEATRWGRTVGQIAIFELERGLRRVVFCASGRAVRGHRLRWSRVRDGRRGARREPRAAP